MMKKRNQWIIQGIVFISLSSLFVSAITVQLGDSLDNYKKGLPLIKLEDQQSIPSNITNIILNVTNLTDLNDVKIVLPINGQVLTYNSTSGMWENIDSSGGSTGNPFNQSLNTSDDVRFNVVNATTEFAIGDLVIRSVYGGAWYEISGSGGQEDCNTILFPNVAGNDFYYAPYGCSNDHIFYGDMDLNGNIDNVGYSITTNGLTTSGLTSKVASRFYSSFAENAYWEIDNFKIAGISFPVLSPVAEFNIKRGMMKNTLYLWGFDEMARLGFFGKKGLISAFIEFNNNSDWLEFSDAIRYTFDNNMVVDGNITADNVFLPQYMFAHTDETIPAFAVNVWTNVTFAQEDTDIKQGISHTFNDETNHTFTLMEDGIYNIDYDFDVEDTSAGASDIGVAGRLIMLDGTEIKGSVFEIDITKQGTESELSHNFLFNASAGDVFIFQFVASDAQVQISTHGTFGDHPESATIVINKIANLEP